MVDKTSNELLFVKGFTLGYKDCIHLYDVEKDVWHMEIVIPFSIKGNIVSIDNKIYSFQENLIRKKNDKFFSEMSIRVFDLITRKSKIKRLIGKKLWGRIAGVWDGLIYFYNESSKKFYCYDPEKNSVEMLGSTIGHYGYDLDLVNQIIHDGQIYIIGEAREYGTKYSISEVFNLETKESKIIASFPEELPDLTFITVTVFNNKLYAVMKNSLENLYVYSFDKNEWESIECYSRPAVKESTLICCQNKLICVDYRMFLHIYDPNKNEWESRIDYNGPMISLNYVHTIVNLFNLPTTMPFWRRLLKLKK